MSVGTTPTRYERIGPGFYIRHVKGCGRPATRCKCSQVRAQVSDPKTGKRIYLTHPNLTEAKKWRRKMETGFDHGQGPPSERLVRDALADLISRIEDGTKRTRSGDPYKPAAIRKYRSAVKLHLNPALGSCRLCDLSYATVQPVVDLMVRGGLSSSTVRNALDPLRVLCGEALKMGLLPSNPVANLDLPSRADTEIRDRIATPAEMRQLIAAIPEGERAIWATAAMSGLRWGEIQALTWADVDLKAGWITVRHTWDEIEGLVETKTKAGARRVPFDNELREHLEAHRRLTGRVAGLVFGRTASDPCNNHVRKRAMQAWGWKTVSRPGESPEQVWVKVRPDALEPITPHECRHTWVSHMVAAGYDFKRISVWAGHSTIAMTLDTYGHLVADENPMEKRNRYFDSADAGAQ